ncbi:CTP pyrophosphohydrolase [Fundidesulfovibrio magnetotacticus]|uniref:8-oxo-dGTP diphosphatase n=1 Tax=Fundidesulfovibrio magnetotacticus TaxID=2730080 RepID=A0A6V8LWF7_9BACT|nr:(deoxy)nucleoside triphosphate pyrophosphohydrolase [Fundidesulfovibrio magnetotacticus]GFK92605.1 CTP pyrophosphohydrolase [Fundidesulfovibrio magnetotacticus]
MIHVVAGILWRDGLCLGVRRPEGKAHAGLWEFPGGKVEAGEDPAQALVRELREELGIEAREPRYWREKIHEYPGGIVRLSFFHIRDFKGVPRPLEGQGLRWLTPAQARELPFLEADRDIVEALAQPPDAP